MPQSFSWRDFKSGWCPSDDAFNGRKDALLMMDNVELDKNGSISLAGGTSVVGSAYANAAHDIFSNVISGTRHDYVSDTSGSTFRDGASIVSGGDTAITAFGVAYNYTLICSNTKRVKDVGSGTPVNLGLQTPSTIAGSPTPNTHTTAVITISGATPTHVEINCAATYSTNKIEITPTASTGATQSIAAGGPINWATLASLNAGPAATVMTPDDIFPIRLFEVNGPGTLGNVASVTFDILLVAPGGGGAVVTDYFSATWDNQNGGTTAASTTIDFKRSDFSRIGGGTQGWSTVYGFRITVVAAAGRATILDIYPNKTPNSSGGFGFQGGLACPLTTGDYEYAVINVNRNSNYLAKSQLGPATAVPYFFDQGSNLVAVNNPTGVDAQCNEVWLFRRGGTLTQWYRVLVYTAAGGYGSQEDSFSDDDARALNITVNLNLISVNSTYLTDKIKGIIGPIEGRWIFFTDNAAYPSDINSPDLVDTTIAVKFTGGNSESFLWARKVDPSTILIGTSVDIYVLTGTFATLPDYTVDIYLRPLACKYPPITFDSAYYSGAIFYMANDGWRSIDSSGQNPSLVIPNTDRLYRGITAYGYSVNTQVVPGTVRFPTVIARGKLWGGINGQNRIEVLDFKRAYWRNLDYTSLGTIQAMCSTQDGLVLVFFGGDKKLRVIDVQSSLLIDGATKQAIQILSPVFECDTPRQRKELYVIKVNCATGFDNLTVTLIEETGVTHTLGTIGNVGFAEFDLTIGTGIDTLVLKNFQLKFTGTFAALTISVISVDYDVRPQQLPALHVQAMNLGSSARKRLSNLPFSIDTISGTTVLSVYLDGSLDGTLSITNARKTSYSYEFPVNSAAFIGVRDIELFFSASSGAFEFFGLTDPRRVETFPDQVLEFITPQTNYGSSSRKRIRLLKFVLDCLATTVFYAPTIDNTTGVLTSYTGAGKATFYYYFTADQIGVDFQHLFLAAGPFELWEVMEPAADDIELFPDRVRFYTLPVTNYGTTSRKRVRLLKFVLDPIANNVTFTPIIDGATQTTTTFAAGSGKKTVYHYYTSDQIGVDFSGTFSSSGPFELWQIIPPSDIDIEIFPDRLRYYRSPKTNFGIDARKRIRTWSYVIDPLGATTVAIIIYIDGSAQAADHSLDTLTGKRTGFHTFNPDVIGYDFEFEVVASGPVEVWAINPPGKDEIEVFPEPVNYFTIPTTNYGHTGRKRVRVIKFVLDTKGNDVVFTPKIDGSSGATSTFNSARKSTFIHYYTDDEIGVDFSGTLSAATGSFEVWDVIQPSTANDIELFPDRVKYFITPKSNFGIDARKRLRTWSYVINPLLAPTLTINIYIDGVNVITDTSLSTLNGKRTGYIVFNPDQIGVDFEMEIIADSPIEIWDIPAPNKDEIEVFPSPIDFYTIPTTNFGNGGRKRLRLWKFVLDCLSATVNFNPIIDGNVGSLTVFSGAGKKTFYHYFTNDSIGVDFSGQLSGTSKFELWEVMQPNGVDIENFPDRLKYFISPKSNFGIDARKRIRTWGLVINPLNSSSISINVKIDGSNQTADTSLTGVNGKQTFWYHFRPDQIGVDFEYEIVSDDPFELWEVIAPGKDEIEVYPEPVKFFTIPTTNFGSTSRKRVRVFKFVLDTRSSNVVFTPIIDGSSGSPVTFNGGKKTYFYFYTSDQIGIDFSGTLSGTNPFEVWNVIAPTEIDIEVFPDRLEYYITPKTNFGVDARKRIRAWAVVINPLGSATLTINVYIDGSLVVTDNSLNGQTGKRTTWIQFNPDHIGVDFEMEIIGSGPFEVFDVMSPGKDEIEIYPEPVEFLTIPTTNFGNANKKRVRVWPFIIDTKSQNVTFTPIVDGSTQASVTFNTSRKETVFYFFKTDVFGIDYSGTFNGGNNTFELWQVMNPDIVETLPIARQFDQVGPEELYRFGRLLQLELRVLPFGTTIPYTIYFNDGNVLDGNLTVVSGLEQIVSLNMPKGVGGEIVRIEIGPTNFNFHRYYIRILVQKSGMDTQNKWVTLPAPVEEA